MPLQPTSSRIFFTTYSQPVFQCLWPMPQLILISLFLSLASNLLQTFLGTPSQAFTFNSSSPGWVSSWARILWILDQGVALSSHPHTQPCSCAFPTSTSVQQPGWSVTPQQHHPSTEHIPAQRYPDCAPHTSLRLVMHPCHPPFQPPRVSVGFVRPRTPFPPLHLSLPSITVCPVPPLSFPQSPLLSSICEVVMDTQHCLPPAPPLHLHLYSCIST